MRLSHTSAFGVKIGTDEDRVARALHLASSEAAFTTATILPIDGGTKAMMPARSFASAEAFTAC